MDLEFSQHRGSVNCRANLSKASLGSIRRALSLYQPVSTTDAILKPRAVRFPLY